MSSVILIRLRGLLYFSRPLKEIPTSRPDTEPNPGLPDHFSITLYLHCYSPQSPFEDSP